VPPTGGRFFKAGFDFENTPRVFNFLRGLNSACKKVQPAKIIRYLFASA
jgi:hypothetical protein